MSISMRLSCNVPRNGCLPRFLHTHGDMNEAMSHASMKGTVEKHREWLSGAAVRETSRAQFPGEGAVSKPPVPGVCPEHLEGAPSIQTCRSASCVHHIAPLTGED